MGLQFSLDPQFMEIVRDLFLILEQPVDCRLTANRLLDGLGRRLTMHVKEGLVVEVVHFQNGRIKPNRVDDSQVVDLILGDVACATASKTPLAIAAWTVPIRMLVYLPLLTVTLLTISVRRGAIFHKLANLGALWHSIFLMGSISSMFCTGFRKDLVRRRLLI